jgi:hypothetical protein
MKNSNSSHKILNDTTTCIVFRCCVTFPDLINPEQIAKLLDMNIDLLNLHLKQLIDDKLLLLENTNWITNIDQSLISQACKAAEQSYLLAQTSRKVDIQGRLEWLSDAYQMIQLAKKSYHETIS